MRNLNKFFVLILPLFIFACCMFVPKAGDVRASEANNASAISAQAYVLMDAETGKVLKSHNEQARLPMASTTKILTALVAIENSDVNKLVKIDKKAVGIEGSSIYLRQGEEMKMLDLLYGLMLRSGNDAATAIAIEVGGSVEGFADMMNKKAKEIGALNSHFDNPHGLDSKTHYTTAYDLALISSKALENDILSKICATKTHKVPANNVSNDRIFVNKNKMLSSYDGAIGLKTGYTKKCGRCLVSGAERDGVKLVSVVLNAPSMWLDSSNLLDYGFNNYKKVEFISANLSHGSVKVENGKVDSVNIKSEKGYTALVKKGEEDNYKLEISKEESVSAPVVRGQKLGEIKLYYKDELIFNESISAENGVKSTKLEDVIKDVIKDF